MEPRREEQHKAPPPSAVPEQKKQKRFRIVKLEDRIAPRKYRETGSRCGNIGHTSETVY